MDNQPQQNQPQQNQPQQTEKKDNCIYIGKKETMAYVLAVVTQFNNGSKDVSIMARGKAISHAVDVAEIVRNRFMPDAKLKDIQIKTEDLTSEDGRKSRVSAINITLTR